MRYTFHNPNKADAPNHAFSFDADDNQDALLQFVKQAPMVGFYPDEVNQLVKEFTEGDMTHVEVMGR